MCKDKEKHVFFDGTYGTGWVCRRSMCNNVLVARLPVPPSVEGITRDMDFQVKERPPILRRVYLVGLICSV